MTANDSKFELERPGVEQVLVNGLAAVQVSSKSASGLVFLQGAQLAAFQPAGQEPVIWMSENANYAPGKALRGGVPICFPWFGAHPEQREFPAHGFARTRAFEYRGARVDSAGRTELEFVLESDEQTRVWFPYAFTARLRIALGQTLGLKFLVSNRDTQPFAFEEALHSYFAVADVTQAAVRGLEGARYVDKVREQAVFTEGTRELRFVAETDRVYESTATCTIEDPAAKRVVVIEKENSAATVVWNPWETKADSMSDLAGGQWPHFVCIETVNALENAITLAPGASHTMKAIIARL